MFLNSAHFRKSWPPLLNIGLVSTASAVLLGSCSFPSGHSMSGQASGQMSGQAAGQRSGSEAPAQDAHAEMMSMDLGPKDAEFDLRFLDGMILHHQGAIQMAQALQENTARPEMKQLAQEIIAAQQSEIDQMKQWRQQWYPKAGAEPVMFDGQMGHTMAMTPEMQAAMTMAEDLGKADSEYDLRFLEAMVPHHEGALVMAKAVLENSDRPELKQLAESILATQEAEIAQMKRWQQAWYGR